MKNSPLNNWIRVVLALSGALLIVVLFVPLWYIDLAAPQYPEGLRLLIYTNNISGDVEIINGLNHYIGMKTIHTADFVEFKVLPYIVAFFSFAFFVVAFLRNRKLMYLLFTLIVIFGVGSMVDFWLWEYNYGHNLDPTAAIIVPDMAYQPPLIGFKQLLNFGAYSMPDIGGWIFFCVGISLMLCIILDLKYKKINMNNTMYMFPIVFLTLITFTRCTSSPEPIKVGRDNCDYCSMTISDVKYGAEILTKKGKVFKFDEASCLLEYIKEEKFDTTNIEGIYLTDFCGEHVLVNKKNAYIFKSELLKSPMAGNAAAFSNLDSMMLYKTRFEGEVKNFDELLK